MESRHSLIHCQEDGYRFLASKVLEQSKEDLLGDDPIMALDSLFWWVSGGGGDLIDFLGIHLDEYKAFDWILEDGESER